MKATDIKYTEQGKFCTEHKGISTISHTWNSPNICSRVDSNNKCHIFQYFTVVAMYCKNSVLYMKNYRPHTLTFEY